MKKFSSLLLLLLVPHLALAQYGLDIAGKSLPQGTGSSFADKLASALGSVLGSFLAFLGVVFLVLMVAGGLKWMTAGGDEKKVESARGLITQAIIGLVIVLSAYAITANLGDNIKP